MELGWFFPVSRRPEPVNSVVVRYDKEIIMKRDFELIRKLLLHIEGEQVELSSYKKEQILYHKALLLEEGLAEGPKPHYSSRQFIEIPDKVIIHRLTWEGHTLIDAIRDEGRWQKVKDWVKEAGKTLTLETLKEALRALFS
jgi:hypothetical protein